MANCAWTEYKVYDTKENIQILVKAIEKANNMCDIAKNLNVDFKNYSIRGTLIDKVISEDGTNISMMFDCDWDWQEDFIKVLQSKFPNMEIYFYCTECGFDVYVTNSFVEFPTRYIVEDSNDIYECFNSLEDVIDYLKTHKDIAQYRERLDFSDVSSEEEIDDLFNEWNQENDDVTLYLRIFEEI